MEGFINHESLLFGYPIPNQSRSLEVPGKYTKVKKKTNNIVVSVEFTGEETELQSLISRCLNTGIHMHVHMRESISVTPYFTDPIRIVKSL